MRQFQVPKYCTEGERAQLENEDLVLRNRNTIQRKQSYLCVTLTELGWPKASVPSATIVSRAARAVSSPSSSFPALWRLVILLVFNTCSSSSSRFMSYISPSNSTDKDRVWRVWTNRGLYSEPEETFTVKYIYVYMGLYMICVMNTKHIPKRRTQFNNTCWFFLWLYRNLFNVFLIHCVPHFHE